MIDPDLDLNLIEERKKKLALTLTNYYKERIVSFNKKVRWRQFQEGELVLWRIFDNIHDLIEGIFSPSWEGTYKY